jgi:hypothetical protein
MWWSIIPYVVGAYGSYQQGDATEDAFEDSAGEAFSQGYGDEQLQRRRARQFFGIQAASIAQAGLGYDGTIGRVIEQSETNAELDALNLRYRGLQRGRGLIEEGFAAKQAGKFGAGGNALSGASTLFGQRS